MDESRSTHDLAADQIATLSRQEVLPPGTVTGEYVIDAKIGAGGMGDVYAAHHPVIGKRCAVKVLHRALSMEADSVARFVQEAQTVNRIAHPGIVDVFGFGILPDGRRFFLMEWLDGEDLGARIRRAPLAMGLAVELADQICSALQATHAKGVIHRDLKPANIFLTGEPASPKVELLDFGIAKLEAGAAVPNSIETQSGVILGSPHYMAPEQIRGQQADWRVDVYALGAVLYEMMTARRLFQAASTADLISAHLREPPPKISASVRGVSKSLDQLVSRMLAKDRAERPSLQEIRTALAEIRQELRATSRRRQGVLSRVGILLAAVVGVALVGRWAGEGHWRSPRASPRPPVVAPAVTALTAGPGTPAGSSPGTLIIRLNVPDARVELDGQVIASSVKLVRRQVPGGSRHRLRVSARGRQEFQAEVDVPPGQPVEVPVVLANRRDHHPAASHRPAQVGNALLNPF